MSLARLAVSSARGRRLRAGASMLGTFKKGCDPHAGEGHVLIVLPVAMKLLERAQLLRDLARIAASSQ